MICNGSSLFLIENENVRMIAWKIVDWSFRRNFLWVSSPSLHTLSREKFVSSSHKYQGRAKLLHTKQLNTALKTATSSRSYSIFSSNSWWEMCSSGNRTRSVRPGGKYRSIQHTKISEILVKWNAPLSSPRI